MRHDGGDYSSSCLFLQSLGKSRKWVQLALPLFSMTKSRTLRSLAGGYRFLFGFETGLTAACSLVGFVPEVIPPFFDCKVARNLSTGLTNQFVRVEGRGSQNAILANRPQRAPSIDECGGRGVIGKR